MPTEPAALPERPDLDQLRRQARELLRGAQSGDAASLSRLATVAMAGDLRLHAAQLAVAREYGFASWTALKAAIANQAPAPTIRPVSSREELATAFDVIGAQFDPVITSADRRIAALDRRFDKDRSLMLVVCDPGIAGGALAFRSNSGDVTLRIIGLPARLRRQGLGRELVARIAAEAKALGNRQVSVGGVTPDTRPFYERTGFHGRRSMMRLDF